MNDDVDVVNRTVTRTLQERFDAAGDPLPWGSVVQRPAVPDAPPVSAASPPRRTRWLLAAASVLLIAGVVVAGLASISRRSETAVSDSPPPRLEEIVLSDFGPNRPLSLIVPGEVVVPTRLFAEVELEPVGVIDEWTSRWSAHNNKSAFSDSAISVDVSTGMDSEMVGSPDVELTAGGVDWKIRSFGAGDHLAFAGFDRLRVFVTVRGMALDDLVVILDGLRAGEPDAHSASTFDVQADPVEVTRLADGSYQLDVVQVDEWLCWTVHEISSSAYVADCAIPDPHPDGSMLLGVTGVGQWLDPEATGPGGPIRAQLFTVGFVPTSALGATIIHPDRPEGFARAEDRSGDFDVSFVLGVTTFDTDGELDVAAEMDGIKLRPVFPDD